MINSELLDSIENELIQNNQPSYQKIIPIKNYSYETKRTLDLLVEKYGGYINRYDDKIIIFINANSNKNQAQPIQQDDNKYASLKFEKVNASINNIDERLTMIEEKMERISEEQNKYLKNNNKYLASYLNYFHGTEDKREIGRLAEEIINHH